MGLQPAQGRSGRTYQWDNRNYFSVTTILGCLNKPALPGWAARSVAEYVIKNFATVAELADRDPKAAVDLMKGAPWRQREAAADLGTAVHHAVEQLQAGLPGDYPGVEDPSVIPYIASFEDWYDHYKPQVLVSEGTVFNREYDYAGTLDLIARIDGHNWLIDVKSGKGVYPEYALQVAAYARGEFIGHADGSEEPLPIIDRGAILHLKRDGYAFIPVNIGKEVFDSFLYCREMFRWVEEYQHTALKPEMRPPSARASVVPQQALPEGAS